MCLIDALGFLPVVVMLGAQVVCQLVGHHVLEHRLRIGLGRCEKTRIAHACEVGDAPVAHSRRDALSVEQIVHVEDVVALVVDAGRGVVAVNESGNDE